MRFRISFLFLSLALIVSACHVRVGKEDKGHVTESSTPAAQSEIKTYPNQNFDYDSEKCQSASQYCLLSKLQKQNGTEVTLTRECRPLPANCSKQDCFIEDARNAFPTSNNCDLAVYFQGANGKYTVTCFGPGL